MNGNEPVSKQDMQELLTQVVTELRSEIRQQGEQLRSEMQQQGDQFRSEMQQEGGQIRSEMRQHVEQLRSEMHHQYDDLVERINDCETRLLNGMYSIAESGQKRIAELEGTDANLKSRLAAIEDRLLEVEKRLNMPKRPDQS